MLDYLICLTRLDFQSFDLGQKVHVTRVFFPRGSPILSTVLRCVIKLSLIFFLDNNNNWQLFMTHTQMERIHYPFISIE